MKILHGLLALSICLIFVTTVYAEQATFDLNQKLSIVNLKAGETVKKNIGIENKLSEPLHITIAVGGAVGAVKLSENDFNLQPQSQKQVEATFLSEIIGVSTGKFIVSSGTVKKELPFISEVWSAETSYAPKLDIPAEFRSAKSGYDLNFRLSILSQNPEENKVQANFKVLDFNNKIVSEKAEEFSVVDSVSVLRKIPLPDLPAGDYVLAVIANNNNSISTNTKIFSVESGADIATLITNNLLYVLVTIVVAVVVLLYINYGKLVDIEKKGGSRGRNIVKHVTKVKNVVKNVTHVQKITKIQRITKVIRPKEKEPKEYLELSKRRLERQLASLDAAYKAGYIKKEAYLKGKERLETMMKSIDKKLKRD